MDVFKRYIFFEEVVNNTTCKRMYQVYTVRQFTNVYQYPISQEYLDLFAV